MKRYNGKADEEQNSTWKTMKLNPQVGLGNGQNTCPSIIFKCGHGGNKQSGEDSPTGESFFHGNSASQVPSCLLGKT